MNLASDYAQRVYAGVLGKVIGVYLGRPIEAWPHERILREIGEVWRYCNERLKVPLVVTDDDISGTFTFVRALQDHGASRTLTAEQIGKTWLNYLIEKKTVLWWGGLGNSTEHTAYLRLKRGIPAPRSGSIELNTKLVAEQIGAQIFVDGWAMVCPGDPEQAAYFAREAASVSHDGEAIYGAQMIAAMEAQAFITRDLPSLYDAAIRLIPQESTIYRMVQELRDLRTRQDDWRGAFRWLRAHYGYDKFGGNCHIVPNHGVIHIGLLWGDDSFQKSLMVACTCGWDVDCNAANVGCLMGIKNGLIGIDAGEDFRSAVADRLFLPTADGGASVTDAVRQADWLVNMGRVLAGEAPLAHKQGARFHFEMPGSVQGFTMQALGDPIQTARVENVLGHSRLGSRCLAIHCQPLAAGHSLRVLTATFIVPEMLGANDYGMLACPTLYSGQTVRAVVGADASNRLPARCQLLLEHYDAEDGLQAIAGEMVEIRPDASAILLWKIPDTKGMPITRIGLEVTGPAGAPGTLYLDSLDWNGEPDLSLAPPEHGQYAAWRKSWIEAADRLDWGPATPRIVQNEGRGLAIYGSRDWHDYQVRATLTPHMLTAAGLAIRVQGLLRYYAIILRSEAAQLIKVWDDQEIVLCESPFKLEMTQAYDISLQASGSCLQGSIDGSLKLEARDPEGSFEGGGIALICDEGRCGIGAITIRPLQATS